MHSFSLSLRERAGVRALHKTFIAGWCSKVGTAYHDYGVLF
jgi:hypothetical protein